MRKIAVILFVALLATPIGKAMAWGQEGHRIVGQVAYNHLTKKAKKNVDKVLGRHGIVYCSTWADEIKSDTIYPTSYDWHFQDLDGGLSDEAVVRTLTLYPAMGGNLWRMSDSLTNVLRREPDNVDALRFVIHLTGDRFCPMHTAHLEDLGGNKVKLKWFGEQRNLHWVWDEGIISARGYSYSEYAEYLENHLAGEIKKIQEMTIEEITLHNYHFCESVYQYQDHWDGNAYHYVYHFAADCEWQLYAAGIRLAMVLNEIYG